MGERLRHWFPLDMYSDPVAQYRARGTYLSATAIGLATAISLIAILLMLVGGASLQNISLASLLVSDLVLLVAAPVAIFLTRTGKQMVSALVILAVWYGIAFYACIALKDVELGIIVSLTGMALGALLVGESSVQYLAIISIVGVFTGVFLGATPSAVVQTFIPFTFLILIPAVIIYGLAHGLPEVTRLMIAQQDDRRLQLSETSSILIQKLLGSRLDLDNLLKVTVIQVRDTYPDIADVQLFLADRQRHNATLVASTRTDAALGQQVGIGSLSVVGRVTITGQSIVVRDTSEDRPYRRTALLPGIRTELALPLRVGEEVIGVLEVHSGKPGAFEPEEIKVLETAANQIAIAIDNARLYAEAQQQLTENKRLFEQARSSLREIERLNQQLTSGAWAEYLRSQPVTPAFTIDLVSGRVENAAEWTPTLADAARRNTVSTRQTSQARTVALPISVRGQAIGAMEFEIAPDQEVSSDQMTILQQVVERLGLAAENTRLFEEAQRLAQREALVNEISTRLQGTTNVEGVIAAATQSLADAFHSPRVAIRLGTPNDDSVTATDANSGSNNSSSSTNNGNGTSRTASGA